MGMLKKMSTFKVPTMDEAKKKEIEKVGTAIA